MSSLHLRLLIVCTLGLIGCTDAASDSADGASAPCEAMCELGETRCTELVLEQCVGGNWVAARDCSLLGQVCDSAGERATCSAAGCREDQIVANGECFDLDSTPIAGPDAADVGVTDEEAPVIEELFADAYQGLVPFATALHWQVSQRFGSELTCEVDLDGDSTVDVVEQDCSVGQAAFTYAEPGRYNVLLTVRDAAGRTARRGQIVFANALSRSPDAVAIDEIENVLEVTYTNSSVEIALADGAAPGGIEVGHVLQTPDGEYRRVQAVDESDGVVSLETVPASMFEYFDSGFYGVRFPEPVIGDPVEGIEITMESEDGDQAKDAFVVNDHTLIRANLALGRVFGPAVRGNSVELEWGDASLTLDAPSIGVVARIDYLLVDFDRQTLNAVVTAGASFDADFTVEIELAKAVEKAFPVPNLGFGFDLAHIGRVHAGLVLELAAEASLSGKVAGHVNLDYVSSIRGQLTSPPLIPLNWLWNALPGEDTELRELTSSTVDRSDGFTALTVAAEGTLKFAARPKLTLHAGAPTIVPGGLGGRWDIDDDDCAHATGLDISVGFYAEASAHGRVKASAAGVQLCYDVDWDAGQFARIIPGVVPVCAKFEQSYIAPERRQIVPSASSGEDEVCVRSPFLTCTDECMLRALRCAPSSGEIEQCQTRDGCTAWVGIQNCASDKCGSATTCCIDECAALGAACSADGASTRSCAADSFGCHRVSGASCAFGCQNAACKPAPVCTDADGDGRNGYSAQFCAAGPDRCDGNANNWTATGCTACIDRDHDGYGASCDRGADCDDANAGVHSTCTTDAPPAFNPAPTLADVVTFPERRYFTGRVQDAVGLKSASMIVSGPKGTNITAFTETLAALEKDLSQYYFDSSNSAYAGVTGNYTVVLRFTDTANQVREHTESVIVSCAGSAVMPSISATPASTTTGAATTVSVTVGTAASATQLRLQCAAQDSNYPGNPDGMTFDAGVGAAGRAETPSFTWTTTGTKTIYCATFTPTWGAACVASRTIGVGVPTQAPAVDTIAPQGYVDVHPPLTGGTSVAIQWQAEDAMSGLASVLLEYTVDGTNWTPVPGGNRMLLPYENSALHPVANFVWAVPDVETSQAAIRIAMVDNVGNARTTVTDPFAIVAACQAPTTPYTTEPGVSSPTGVYDVAWLNPGGATSFVLEESSNASFIGATTSVLVGLSRHLSGKANGTWYYRVRAVNDCGQSDWSSTVDMVVDVNQPPAVPSQPTPAPGAAQVSRTPTLGWSGGDAEGAVEYAVRFGTNPADLGFVQSFSASQSVTFDSALAAATTYYWQVRARDQDGIVTEGPLWSFTTVHAFPDLVATSLAIVGTVAPGATVTANLSVQNQGDFASLPCRAWLYLGGSSGAKERPLFAGFVDVPALQPGASTVVSAMPHLDDLTAGTSYVTAEIETADVFPEAMLTNNITSTAITYVDTSAPVIDEIMIRGGSGTSNNQYLTDHTHRIDFWVHDDVGIGCKEFDLEYSGNGGASWQPIVLDRASSRVFDGDGYDWLIPPSTTLTSNAVVRLTVRDDVGNSATMLSDVFEVVDGTPPSVTLTSPNGGEIWSLGSTMNVTWTASAPTGISNVRVYVYIGDDVEVLPLVQGNPGTQSWTIPNTVSYASEDVRVRVVATDAYDNTASDWSDASLAIRDASAVPPAPWHTPEVVTSTATCSQPSCFWENLYPKVATDSTGTVHLVYVYKQSDGRIPGLTTTSEVIYYRKRISGVWGATQVAADLGSNTTFTSVADLDITIDASDRPHVAWIRKTSGSDSDAHATWYTGSAWQAAVNVSNDAASSGDDVSVLVSAANDAYVFWRTSGSLGYRSHAAASTTWTSTATVAGVSGVSRFEARRGAGGRPQIAYTTGTAAAMQVALGASAWGTPSQVGACSAAITAPALAASNTGSVDVVTELGSSPWTVGHHSDAASGASCHAISTGIAGQNPVASPVIAYDPNGLPTISWIEEGSGAGRVYVRRMVARPSTWTPAMMVNRITQYANNGQIGYAVDTGGTAHVAWMSYVSGKAEIHYNYGDLTVDTVAPTVQVIAPVAEETIAAGSTFPVVWTASDAVGVASVDVFASFDQGSTWSTLATDLSSAATTTNWNVPGNQLGPVLVQVVATDAAGNEGSATQSAIVADAAGPTVQLLDPLGGEQFVAGETQSIEWIGEDAVGVSTVSLYYSTDDGVSWTVIADAISNTGSYDWTVPTVQSSQVRVQVIAVDAAGNQGSDASDSAFTIDSPNAAPVRPFGSTPAHLASDVPPAQVTLAWSGADSDGDALTYDVYFGSNAPLGSGDRIASDFDASSYELGALSASSTYYWRIDSSDGLVTTTGDVWTFSTGVATVAAPSQLAARVSAPSTVALEWLDVASDETSYEVERKTGLAGSYASIATLPAGTTSFEDAGRTGSATYVYRVRSLRGGLASAYSNEAQVTTGNAPPHVPSAPLPSTTAVAQATTPTLSWTGGDPDLDDSVSYRVFFGQTATPREVTTTASTSYAPAVLLPATFYYWRVVATDSHGDSVSSPVWWFATTIADAPAAPLSFGGSITGPGTVTLTWSGLPVPNDGVQVERRRNSEGFFEPLAIAATSPWIDTALAGHTMYEYRVRTIVGTALSDPSQAVALSVPNQAPTIAAVSSQAATAGTEWTHALAVDDADGDYVSLDLVDPPSGVSIDASAVVRWTPGALQVGVHTFDALARDPAGASATRSIEVTVASACAAIELCGTETDEDCDGVVDEGFGDLDTPCSVGVGGCANDGTRVCSADGSSTVCSATPSADDDEICDDAIDNDCDGAMDSSDDDCAADADPCDLGATRACGSETGTCVAGTQRCEGAPPEWSDCEGATEAVAEICGNDTDDDCNGTVDDTCPCTANAVRSCGQAPGECHTGRQACGSDLRWGPCDGAPEPATETCNGKDDDCDGLIDFAACFGDGGEPECPDASAADHEDSKPSASCSAAPAGRSHGAGWLVLACLVLGLARRARARRADV